VYRLLGPSPHAAAILNAMLGTVVAITVFLSVGGVASRRCARAAGVSVAMHPGMVLFTPCIMSEGAFTAAISLAAFGVIRAARGRHDWTRWTDRSLLGISLAGAMLIRPQAILCLPFFSWSATRAIQSRTRRALAIAWIGLLALGLCVPWTVRNGHTFGRYAFVSMNGGWNLLIGAQPGATGGWQSVQVPASCSGVFGEAETDSCFAREARHLIVNEPIRWVLLAPRKLAFTFDCGAIGGYYLFLSNPKLFPWRAVLGAAGFETLVERAALFVCLIHEARRQSARQRLRRIMGYGGAAFLLTPAAWISVVSLALLLLPCWSRARPAGTGALRDVVSVILWTTIATHAVFFGEPRFAMVTYPWVIALAAVGLEEMARTPRLPREPSVPSLK
jgi:4-amino-4-deoxy-L-arabinose transferase-like glycosyltransferase